MTNRIAEADARNQSAVPRLARPHVIILNGVSSVGKSSTAKALQDIAAAPFLHIALDDFLNMLPRRVFDNPEGITFEKTPNSGGPCVAVRTGPVVERVLSGMRRAVMAMATAGNNLIVDEVMWADQAVDYRALLSNCELRFVGLFAPLDIVEERERRRGDRDIGLARWQHDRVHRNVHYHLKLDAVALSATERARAISEAFELAS